MLKPKTSDEAKATLRDRDRREEAKQELLTRFKKSRDASRALQKTKLKEGVEGIERYVEDVEGDWLENWSDNEE